MPLSKCENLLQNERMGYIRTLKNSLYRFRALKRGIRALGVNIGENLSNSLVEIDKCKKL